MSDGMGGAAPTHTSIDYDRLEELLQAERFLDKLEAWGVDNWEGYGLARREMLLEDEADANEEA